jgi:hypothetical protein
LAGVVGSGVGVFSGVSMALDLSCIFDTTFKI